MVAPRTHQERSAPQTDAADISAGQNRGARRVNNFSSVGYGMYIPRRNSGGPIHTNKHMSTKIFSLADGHPTPATNIAMLEHRVRDMARIVNMVTELANQSLLSGGNLSDTGYVSVCDGEEVNIYDGHTTKITVSEKASLKGWR